MSFVRTSLANVLRKYITPPELPTARVVPSAGLAIEVAGEDGSRVMHNFDPRSAAVELAEGRVVIWRNGTKPQQHAGAPSWAFESRDQQVLRKLYADIQRALCGTAGASWLRPIVIGALAGAVVLMLGSPGAPVAPVTPAEAAVQPSTQATGSALQAPLPAAPAHAAVSPDEAKMVAGLQGAKLPGGAGPTYYVFSDPNCPFCKELEKSVETLSGYQPVILPLGYKPGSRDLAAAVMCSADPGREWMRAMAGTSTAKPCEKGYQLVEENMRAFEKLGLNSTPTMLTPKGVLVTGSASPSELRSVLQQ